MTVISSQKFRDWNIVNEKMNELENVEKLVCPVIPTFLQDFEGNDLYILTDMHHRLTAAIELGIPFDFKIVDDEISDDKAILEKNGESICESWYMGDDWYYIYSDNDNLIGDCVW